ncbi:MAG: undecaprenyldiphospho-muramoylpentapeptide beta-N-acetylglucosaminyltransferase, partial [Candidatus Tectomicrobia bacterium]|nr:undecaprenyldiphospho-muramoylpentapeptide beta-N-acetylglucosaminyltransferase [Candidatus Tectomicrobia bacterium]
MTTAAAGRPSLRILVAAGGTGGHLYPGIAVARSFQDACPNANIAFLGRRGGQEERLVPKEGYRLHTVNVRGLQGRTRLAQLQSLGVLTIGTSQALRLLRRWRPHLVIGAGGYVMAPALLAAALLRLPRVIMEQNLVPGLTVRVLARYAQRVFTSFPESQEFLAQPQVVCTGTPIRPEIAAQVSDTARNESNRLNVLVVGGSQGAHRLNQAMIEAIPLLAAHRARVQFVHQTGEFDLPSVAKAYESSGVQGEVHAFLHDMPKRYNWAHLVLSRAGASTLAELTACGKPAILVPYPHAADDHQRHNALALRNRGAAHVILDAELTGERIYESLRRYIQDRAQLNEQATPSRRLGRPHAA